MFKILKNAWTIPELRKKLLFTFFVILVFRIGSAIPVPFMDINVLKATLDTLTQQDPGTLVSYLNTLSGGAFANATLFAMSVTPYINASIIMQLLTVAIPALERLSKEGEEGRKKIAQYTRYATVILGLIQGFAFYMFLRNSECTVQGSQYYGMKVMTQFDGAFTNIYVGIFITLVFTAGSALMMWLGEQINQKGIGNGISILLFAGIVSQGPQIFTQLYVWFMRGLMGETKYLFFVPLMLVVFLGVIGFIVFMNNAERRIPIQYAKRVVGRKMYGGQSTHIPIKVNMSGVMPIIFASSILSIPGTIKLFVYGSEVTQAEKNSFWYKALNIFSATDHAWLYCIIFFILIILFAYFYVTIQYNPIEMANNLRKNSGTVPGIRPGKATADFIGKIISRITLIGALFLSVIAILPIVLGAVFKEPIGMSGTSILIMVGVALETVQQIESQMLMRHYKGFLE
ncbi:MAG: preprotein translocase subunit SecY [Ruminococcaceae bacterium]|nr:preprotein translocase subunit SecY [Oscillospiraceae bacterium]